MKRATVIQAALAFGLVFATVVFGPGIVDAVEDYFLQPKVRPMTATVDGTFQKVREATDSATSADMASLEAANTAAMDRLAEQIATGTVPEELISEGADDAPSRSGDYDYTIFSERFGPFAQGDLPGGPRIACFSGRDGKAYRHVVVRYDTTHITVRDPDTLNGWVFSNCSDALRMGRHHLTPRKYLVVRRSLLPEGPAFDGARADYDARIKALGWSWPGF